MIRINNCQSFINALSIPLILFSAFAIVAAIKLLIIYIKVQLSKKKLIRNCRSNTNFSSLLEKLQLIDKAYLIESEKHFAFCLGIRHPKIYISMSLANLLTPEELEAVLRHERYHLNNRDTLTMLVASVSESLLPFFPIFSDFLRNFRIEREIKADAEAIRGLGDERPIVSVLKKLLATPSVAIVIASAIANHDTLEPRIRALVKKDFHFKKLKASNVLITLCSVFVIAIIALTPVQAVEIHHKGEDVVMICPSNNECLNSCKQIYSANKKNSSENVLYTPLY